MNGIRHPTSKVVLAAFLVATPSVVSAATFEVKVDCEGEWNVGIALGETTVQVVQCLDGELEESIDVLDGMVEQASITATSSLSMTTCDFASPPSTGALEKFEVECEAKAEYADGSEGTEEVKVEIEYEEDEEEEEEEDEE